MATNFYYTGKSEVSSTKIFTFYGWEKLYHQDG